METAYKVGAVKKVSGPVVVGEGMAGARPFASPLARSAAAAWRALPAPCVRRLLPRDAVRTCAAVACAAALPLRCRVSHGLS